MKYQISFKSLLFMCLLLVFQAATVAQNQQFKVVLDAGHGGKDSGAMQNGFYEKKIALNVTLKVGELLQKAANVELIYTRKKDIYLTLKERANIANRKNASLFVSLHCNSADNKKVTGTETLVMGMSRSDMNMDVAKRENAVILLEDDYKEKYNGFDPNKPESLIGLKILQEEYLSQSIELAAQVEQNFVTDVKRKSRGVKQQPIWVLDATYMPSVLIEVGFISNKTEGQYLNSEKGQNQIAKAIANAILEYKKNYFHITETSNSENNSTSVSEDTNSKNIVYKVQISASGKKLETKAYNFKGLSTISREKSGNLYKYFYGNETSYRACQKRLTEAQSKGYKSAFIVAYKDGVKISVAEALK